MPDIQTSKTEFPWLDRGDVLPLLSSSNRQIRSSYLTPDILPSQLYSLQKELRAATPSYLARPGVQRTMSQGTESMYTSGSPFIYGGHGSGLPGLGLRDISEGSIEMQKIKKVQSFFRGWLCRRRWKQIVEQYIKSPHAESMRKRNTWEWFNLFSRIHVSR